MKNWLAIIIVGLCCLIVDGPIGGKLGVMGLIFLGSACRKDKRFKITWLNWLFGLIGLALIAAGFVLIMMQG